MDPRGMQMISRKVTALLASILVFSGLAHADSKRYLVSFKSSAAFSSVAQSIKANRLVAPGVMAPMHLFGSGAVVAQALEHVQLLVVESDNAVAMESLRRHPAVAMVEQEIFHPAPQPMATWSVKSQITNIGNQDIARPWGIDAVKAPLAWLTTKGDGARVMVLDTGLDKEHPAIAANFEKGMNFTGGDASDFTDEVGHGTHVSGTILAAGEPGGLVGVAPMAKLLMGKVCTTQGCSSVAIAGGLDWAVEEHADVVNMSLGGMFLSNAEAQALSRAEAAGVFVAAASGNDGNNRVGYPAAVDTVTAVGAIDSNLVKAEFSQWGPELDVVGPGVDVISSVPRGTGRGATVQVDLDGKGLAVIKSLPFVGSPVLTFENGDVVAVGLGKPEDFASVDVQGKVALIQRGEIPFKDKVQNAIAAGASGVLVYNNAAGLIQGTLTDDGSEVSIPAAMIEQAVGESAKALLDSGESVKATLAIDRTDYASFQGTSMATPHVAGVAALVRAANKTLTPAQVRDILKSTATALGPNDNNEYGSGLVNSDAAVQLARQMLIGVRQAAN